MMISVKSYHRENEKEDPSIPVGLHLNSYISEILYHCHENSILVLSRKHNTTLTLARKLSLLSLPRKLSPLSPPRQLVAIHHMFAPFTPGRQKENKLRWCQSSWHSEKIYTQLAFYVNLHRAVIGPSATLTGRWRPDIDLRRMLTG